jgi:hypothetical protein
MVSLGSPSSLGHTHPLSQRERRRGRSESASPSYLQSGYYCYLKGGRTPQTYVRPRHINHSPSYVRACFSTPPQNATDNTIFGCWALNFITAVEFHISNRHLSAYDNSVPCQMMRSQYDSQVFLEDLAAFLTKSLQVTGCFAFASHEYPELSVKSGRNRIYCLRKIWKSSHRVMSSSILPQ